MESKFTKVLIVDDEPRIGNMYVRVLAEEGYIVRLACDAREALGQLIREEMDVVLIDINMPGINGKTMFEIIKEYDPHTKVIVLSAYPLHVQQQMIPHAFGYHDKSDMHEKLLDMVSGLVEHEPMMK